MQPLFTLMRLGSTLTLLHALPGATLTTAPAMLIRLGATFTTPSRPPSAASAPCAAAGQCQCLGFKRRRAMRHAAQRAGLASEAGRHTHRARPAPPVRPAQSLVGTLSSRGRRRDAAIDPLQVSRESRARMHASGREGTPQALTRAEGAPGTGSASALC